LSRKKDIGPLRGKEGPRGKVEDREFPIREREAMTEKGKGVRSRWGGTDGRPKRTPQGRKDLIFLRGGTQIATTTWANSALEEKKNKATGRGGENRNFSQKERKKKNQPAFFVWGNALERGKGYNLPKSC